jgi:hypothetical protein
VKGILLHNFPGTLWTTEGTEDTEVKTEGRGKTSNHGGHGGHGG